MLMLRIDLLWGRLVVKVRDTHRGQVFSAALLKSLLLGAPSNSDSKPSLIRDKNHGQWVSAEVLVCM